MSLPLDLPSAYCGTSLKFGMKSSFKLNHIPTLSQRSTSLRRLWYVLPEGQDDSYVSLRAAVDTSLSENIQSLRTNLCRGISTFQRDSLCPSGNRDKVTNPEDTSKSGDIHYLFAYTERKIRPMPLKVK
eukprot:scaffold143621_cov36-Cyclotella_meneghiniana.AAC.5